MFLNLLAERTTIYTLQMTPFHHCCMICQREKAKVCEAILYIKDPVLNHMFT